MTNELHTSNLLAYKIDELQQQLRLSHLDHSIRQGWHQLDNQKFAELSRTESLPLLEEREEIALVLQQL